MQIASSDIETFEKQEFIYFDTRNKV